MPEVIALDYVIEGLKERFKGNHDVSLAILFGSVVREGASGHDVDVAVKLVKPGKGLLTLGGLVHDLAEALGVSEERVDVVDLDEAPVHLLWRILRDGIVIKANEEALGLLQDEVKGYPDLVLEAKGWVNLDPEPRIDKMIIEAKAAEVRRNVEFLRDETLNRRNEELTYKDILALERAVHRIAEAMLDVCRHLVAVYSLGMAESYGEYPERLAGAGKIPKDLASKLGRLAGLRNILVHMYSEVRLGLLQEAAKEVVDEVAGQYMEWLKGLDP